MKCDTIPMINHKNQVVNGNVNVLMKLMREHIQIPNGKVTLRYEKEDGLGFLNFEWDGVTLSGREASLTVQFQMIGAVGVVSTARHLGRIINKFLKQYDAQEKANVPQ